MLIILPGKPGNSFNNTKKRNRDSAVLDHISTTCHNISLKDDSILAQEPRYGARRIKEYIDTYKRRLSLNKDQDLELPPVLLHPLKPLVEPKPHRGPQIHALFIEDRQKRLSRLLPFSGRACLSSRL